MYNKRTMGLSYFEQDKILVFMVHTRRISSSTSKHTLVFGRKALRGGSYSALGTQKFDIMSTESIDAEFKVQCQVLPTWY